MAKKSKAVTTYVYPDGARLQVFLETTHVYPDGLQDLCNRQRDLFIEELGRAEALTRVALSEGE